MLNVAMRVSLRNLILVLLIGWGGLLASLWARASDTAYCQWSAEDFAIPEPLCGLEGDPVRGRIVVIDRDRGNCLACHQMPIPEEPMHGTIGPPLHGVGARLNEAQLRLRVVDEQQINPHSIMPAFYRHPDTYHRSHPAYQTPVLTAQEVEDVVAYLVTLK